MTHASGLSRRGWLAAAAGFAARPAGAQDAAPLRLVVGFPPGDSTDFAARMVGEHLVRRGQPVAVDNRTGAGGILSVQQVRNAAPDGRTLLVAPSGLFVVYPHTYRTLPYDARRDLAPLAILATMSLAIGVDAQSGPRTLQELLARMRANPQQRSFSSPAAGSLNHFLGLRLGELAQAPALHVAYRGSAPAKQAVLAGDVGFTVGALPSLQDLAQAGRLRLLATTGSVREPLFPDVPTLREAGVDLEGEVWIGAFAPAQVPADILGPLQRALVQAVADPQVVTRFRGQGLRPSGEVGARVWAAVDEGQKAWLPVIARSAFKADQ